MGASKILLVLGSGKNIGLSVAKSFSSAGYKVVLVSRSADGQTTPEGYTTIQADLAKPDSVPSIFASVKEKLGSSPNVVVYNAAAVSPAADATNPLTVPVKDLEKDLAVANSSPYAAAREAVAGFEGLDKSLPKAFVYTGNRLAAVTAPAANFVTLGVGKSAASYWIGVSSALFKDKGYKFFFADERAADGNSVGREVSGKAAGEFYLELAEGKSDIPWFATFVAGKGYVDFPDSKRR